MRHAGAGLAIPDFPLSFGRLVPTEIDFAIGIHFAHRVGALVVTAAVITTIVTVFKYSRGRLSATIPAVAMSCLVILQVTLGAAVVLTGKGVLVNTAHVATGAALLATSLVLSLNSWLPGVSRRNTVAMDALNRFPGLSEAGS
jgi:heme A synthase